MIFVLLINKQPAGTKCDQQTGKFFLLVRKFRHLTETHFTYLFFFFFAIWVAGNASFLHENTPYLPKLMKKPTWFEIFPKNPLAVLTKRKTLTCRQDKTGIDTKITEFAESSQNADRCNHKNKAYIIFLFLFQFLFQFELFRFNSLVRDFERLLP